VHRRTILLGVMAAIALLTVVLGGIILIPRLLYPPFTAADLQGVASAQLRIQLQQAQSQLANGARSDVLQGFAGLVVVAGAAAAWWQVHISREAQITERFTRAVDQLGSANVDDRRRAAAPVGPAVCIGPVSYPTATTGPATRPA
jgi:hypothetical protein